MNVHARIQKIFPGRGGGGVRRIIEFAGWVGGGVRGIFAIILLSKFNKFSFSRGGGGRNPDFPPRSAHVHV